MIRVNAAVLAVGGAMFATPAFAEEPVEAAAEGTMEPGSPPIEMEGEPVVDQAPPIATPNWPQSAIDRPYVRPKDSITAMGQFSIVTVEQPPIAPVMTSSSATFDFLQVGGAYGVTNEITAGATYGLPMGIADSEFNGKGPLTIFGEYQIKHTSKLSITASADFTYDVQGEDAFINAGLGARYHIDAKMAVFTGAPFGPGPVGRHLTIGLTDPNPVEFDIPVGFAYQATPEAMAYAQTNLATLNFNGPGDTFSSFNNSIPLAIGGIYAVNKNIDAFAQVNIDFQGLGDFWGFAVGGHWYQ